MMLERVGAPPIVPDYPLGPRARFTIDTGADAAAPMKTDIGDA